VIPKTLAVNAAKDSTDLVGTLRAVHRAAQTAPKDDEKKKYVRYGLDLLSGQVRDNVAAGVLEPTMSKVKSLKSAFEAAVSLLRIDDAIACAPGASTSALLSPYFVFWRWRGDALLIRLSRMRARTVPQSLSRSGTNTE
jgi:chaperonin GroEL (HSP60 family)